MYIDAGHDKTVEVGVKQTILVAVLAWLFWGVAAAQDRDQLLADCVTVEACFTALDPAMPAKDRGVYEGDIDAIRVILKTRFGDAAKYALLDKARGAHPGWRNFASAILSDWGDWQESDVPLLREALQLKHGGWNARALGDIGSDAAILALVEDLPFSGMPGQTGWALHGIGPKVLSFLLPVLEAPSIEELGDDWDRRYKGRRGAIALVQAFRSQAVVVADEWIAIARNRREPAGRRIAALRGLGAMNGYLGDKSRSLRSIRHDRDPKISESAFDALVATHDPSVAQEFAETCKPTAEKWSPYAFEARRCLSQLSDFGTNARVAGKAILPFLKSENKKEQLFAIDTLGLISDAEAVPHIEPFLHSSDWRQVYAGVRALGNLKAWESVPEIEAAVQGHWLWELEQYGKYVSTQLIKRQPYADVVAMHWGDLRGGLGNYTSFFDSRDRCNWSVWTYNSERLEFEDENYGEGEIVQLADGKLVGTDKGEFGGALEWRPNVGEPITIVDDNTSHIYPVAGGYISIHGLAHMGSNRGFAVMLKRDENGNWSAEEIARFPGAAYQVKRMGVDVFAANANRRVIIFSPKGIIEAARCDWSARPREKLGD